MPRWLPRWLSTSLDSPAPRQARSGRFQPPPQPLPLPLPRLDGTTWPPRYPASFTASTLYALAQQEAFTAEAHDAADVVLGELLPMLDTGAAPVDIAHMEQVCSAAAQTGAAIAVVESRSLAPGPGTSRDGAAVLWLAVDDLPGMPRQQTEVARYLLLCGYYLARAGLDQVVDVTEALWQEDHPAVRPGPSPAEGR